MKPIVENVNDRKQNVGRSGKIQDINVTDNNYFIKNNVNTRKRLELIHSFLNSIKSKE